MSIPGNKRSQQDSPLTSESFRSTNTTPAADSIGQDFAREADAPERSALLELLDSFRYSKKWWLTPIVVALLLIGLFLVLSTTAAAPFIYTLF